MNIYAWIDENAQKLPSKVCIKTKEREITYAEFQKLTRALGTALRREGIQAGDHVTVMLPNIPEFIISYMAITGIGATVVPVNCTYTGRELANILKDSESKALILEQSNLDTYQGVQSEAPLSLVITTGKEGNFNEWVSGPAGPICETMGKDDAASMVYSSGLTGYPMGAILTHGNLGHNSDLMHMCMDCGEQDSTLTVIPLFHTFSASVNMLSMLRYGGTIYLMKRPDFKEIKQVLDAGLISTICAVPTLFFGLIFHPDVQGADYSKIHTLVAGGSALPMEIYTSFKDKTGLEILQGYGITEASPVCSVNPKRGVNKPATIGPAVPGVVCKVVDDDGREVPRGQMGELLFKGENIMKGYYKRPRETAEILRDGWLYTGDLGHMDDEGYITITGFKKEMVITSGFNVYSREVEGVLCGIDGVRDCAITGVPDLMRGSIIKAYIVKDNPALSEQDIKQFARKSLAPVKTPRQVVFVDSIPRDAKGKAILEGLG